MVVTEDEVQIALGLLPVQREQIKMIEQEMEMKQQQASTARRELFGAIMQRNRGEQGEQQGQGQPSRPGQTEQGGRGNDNQGGDDSNRGRGRFQMDPETQEKMDRLQAESYEKEALSQIGKVLNRPQISKYRDLLGKPFDFSTIEMSGAGGRGFGGGRGGDEGRRRGG
jgi:hypothetical protein